MLPLLMRMPRFSARVSIDEGARSVTRPALSLFAGGRRLTEVAEEDIARLAGDLAQRAARAARA
jgi:hypothetical protein